MEEEAEKTAASASFGDAMKRLNIIDMTGNGAVKIETSVSNDIALISGEKMKKSQLLLKKVLKVKDEAKFNVKALV